MFPDLPKFLSEVKRVLRLSDFFVWTDLYPEMTTQKYDTAFDESSLQKERAYDITQNVLRILDNKPTDDAKKEIIQTQIPFLIREIMRSFSGMKETDIYNFPKNRPDYILY